MRFRKQLLVEIAENIDDVVLRHPDGTLTEVEVNNDAESEPQEDDDDFDDYEHGGGDDDDDDDDDDGDDQEDESNDT